MRYESFYTTKRKIPKIESKQDKANADLKSEDTISVNFRSEIFMKKIKKIALVSNAYLHTVNANNNPIYYREFIFANLQQNYLNMIHIFPVFSVSSGWGDYLSIYASRIRFYYNWEYINTNTYRLYVHSSVSFGSGIVKMNLYAYYLNDYNFLEV